MYVCMWSISGMCVCGFIYLANLERKLPLVLPTHLPPTTIVSEDCQRSERHSSWWTIYSLISLVNPQRNIYSNPTYSAESCPKLNFLNDVTFKGFTRKSLVYNLPCYLPNSKSTHLLHVFTAASHFYSRIWR